MEILCSVAAVLVMIVWIGLYFVLRKRFAWSKWNVELIFVGIPVAVFVFLNYTAFCCLQDESASFGVNFGYLFHAIFNGFGALSFNDLAEIGDTTASWVYLSPQVFAILYYASALFASSMFFVVLVAKANYEFYSRLAMRHVRNKSVFIFTALNAETLALADSIAHTYGKRSSVVIFAIATGKPFDRHDALCQQVMSKGFYYWSYTPRTDKDLSIAEQLHVNNRNATRAKTCRYRIFAFDSISYVPQEEDNMAVAFKDIQSRINSPKTDELRIVYYVLTKRQIKYSVYDYKIRELRIAYYRELVKQYAKDKEKIRNYVSLLAQGKLEGVDEATFFEQMFGMPYDVWTNYLRASRSEKKAHEEAFFAHPFAREAGLHTLVEAADFLSRCDWILSRAFAGRFSVEIWDEASVIAKDILDKSTDLIVDKIAAGKPSVDVLTLGFGETGTAATMALYSHSAYVDEEGVANTFHVHIYDVKAHETGMRFGVERPHSCVVVEDGETLTPPGFRPSQTEWMRSLFDRYCQIAENKIEEDEAAGKDRAPARARLEYQKANFDQRLQQEMNLPRLVFHNENCRSLGFLEHFKGTAGKPRPDFIVVATGDDYANVLMANAIIQWVSNECTLDACRRMDVFVNVWDSNNNALLESGCGQWNAAHNKLTIQRNGAVALCVYVVGNNSTIYTAANTVNVDDSAEYNACYNRVADEISRVAHTDGTTVMTHMGKNGKVETQMHAAEYYAFSDYINLKPDNEDAVLDYALDWVQYYADCITEDGGDSYITHLVWYYALDPWLKESNVMVRLNAKLYRRLLTLFNVPEDIDFSASREEMRRTLRRYRQMAHIEHERWVRLHVAFGWTYNGDLNKRELANQHNGICPYVLTPALYSLYDLGNVLLAWKYGAKS